MFFDLIIINSKIVDGSGNPWYFGDVGIKDGKIAFIGKMDENVCADIIIDAEGQVLSPGFIDVHTHYDFVPFKNPAMLQKVKQGITTQIVSACGISAAPIKPEKVGLLDKYVGFVKAGAEIKYNWESFGEYLDVISGFELGTNIGAYVGQGTIRLNVMGFDKRKPTQEEIEEMKHLVRNSMEEGAFGMSSGLIYPPGVYSEPEEIMEVAKVLKEFDGIYLSHMRNESYDSVKSVKETINVAEKAGIPVQIHHHKAIGRKNWGLVKETMALIEKAREKGLDVTVDQYPYTAGSTTLRTILPPWAQEGGVEKIIERLSDPDTRAKVIDDINNTDDWENFIHHTDGPEGIMILDTPVTPQYNGKNLVEIGKIMGKDPLEAAFDVIIANKGSDNSCFFIVSEEDIRFVLKNPVVMVGSDSFPAPVPGAKVHPRTNGTFARILGKYVREEGLLTLEDAIRKCTSFPANRLGIKDKGLIREGMDADLIIFNPDTIIDRADYEDPLKESVGVSYVIVNGQLTIDKGEFTGKAAGKVIRRG